MNTGKTIALGAKKLTLEDVELVATGGPIELSAEAKARVDESRKLVEEKAASDTPVYGVTTGFGGLAEVKIPASDLAALQRNLILSHSAGVGRPLSREETRAMMMLRAQTLAEGFSGVRSAVIDSFSKC